MSFRSCVSFCPASISFKCSSPFCAYRSYIFCCSASSNRLISCAAEIPMFPFCISSLNAPDRFLSIASMRPICVSDVCSISATSARMRPIFILSPCGLSLFSSASAFLYSCKTFFNSFACWTFSQSVSSLAVLFVKINVSRSLMWSDSFRMRQGTFLYASFPSLISFKTVRRRLCPAMTSYFPCAFGFTVRFCSIPESSIASASWSMSSVL